MDLYRFLYVYVDLHSFWMIGIIIFLVLESCLTSRRLHNWPRRRFQLISSWQGLRPRLAWNTWILESLGDPKNNPHHQNPPNHLNHQNHKRHTFWQSTRGTYCTWKSNFCRALFLARLFLRNAILQRPCSQWPSVAVAESGRFTPQFLVTLAWKKNLGIPYFQTKPDWSSRYILKYCETTFCHRING